MEKIRTTIYISKATQRAIKKNIKNLSAWVEARIQTEFGSDISIPAITEQIMDRERELTQLREMRNALESETARVDEFCRNMASVIKDPDRETIRTPMDAVRVFSSIISEDPVLCAYSRDDLARMITNALKAKDVPGYV